VGCLNGQVVALPVQALHEAGIGANVRGDGGGGQINDLTRSGYKAVPHNLPGVTAFGKARDGAADSVYLEKWVGQDIGGNSVERWTDAWMRPVQFGHQVIWEHDEPGRAAFKAQILIEVANGGQPLSDLQLRMAARPMIERIKAESSRESPAARKLVRQIALHLPRALFTDEVHDSLKRLDIDLPDLPESD
jgi:hypothetical protein